ncbi:hypothetical protein CDAR_383481 [Caerostris darwini]|uniref:Uncharacterized protein n=1 Tax=Caerostris darwini TaxID=1538125 RepID=A0AAV4NWX1_9ARAC|nr:hypothetical protein CDAR_383481 [Caerostris darwini]
MTLEKERQRTFSPPLLEHTQTTFSRKLFYFRNLPLPFCGENKHRGAGPLFAEQRKAEEFKWREARGETLKLFGRSQPCPQTLPRFVVQREKTPSWLLLWTIQSLLLHTIGETLGVVSCSSGVV